MPYLHCPQCHRTAWLSPGSDADGVNCRRCGVALDPMVAGEARFLARALRELRARDARFAPRARFIRDASPPARP